MQGKTKPLKKPQTKLNKDLNGLICRGRTLNLLTLHDLGPERIIETIKLAAKIKKDPGKFSGSLKDKTLLMLFEMPSLRTRLSFEVAMAQLGGHAIYYNLSESTLGEKESVEDFANVVGRYCNQVIARIHSHELLAKLAENSQIPVINGLTSFAHPCQILADMLTVYEKRGKLTGLKLAYVGDSNNNVTHSLIYAASMIGMDITIGCPRGEEYEPQENVVKEAREFAVKSKASVKIFHNAEEAVKDADIVVTDSWMSYRVPKGEKEKRLEIFMPFQVNAKLMGIAKSDAIFMHCLPASRGLEVTAEVIDGRQSVIYDEAENRLHAQKAVLLLLDGQQKK